MKILQGLLIFVLSVSVFAGDEFKAGEKAFQQGDFEKALEYWYEAYENTSPERNTKEFLEASLRLASIYKSLGRMGDSYNILDKALDVSNLQNDDNFLQLRAKVFIQLSDFYVEMRDFKQNLGNCQLKNIANSVFPMLYENNPTQLEMLLDAFDYLEKANKILPEKTSLLKAEILNRQGNILLLQDRIENISDDTVKIEEKWQDKYKNALANLATHVQQDKNIQPAKNLQIKILIIKIKLNLLQGRIENNKKVQEDSLDILKKLIDDLSHLNDSKTDDSHDKNFALISLAQLTRKMFFNEKEDIFKESPFDKKTFDNRKIFAYNLLIDAFESAKKLQDQRSIIYALYEMAKLYELDERYQDAIPLLRKAIFYAVNYPLLRNESQQQLWGYPDILYRLEWDLAKILKKQSFHFTGTPEEHMQSIEAAYKNASDHMEDMETKYSVLPEKFHRIKEKLFMEYANVLLKKAHNMSEETDDLKADKQKVLKNAIIVIESSKVAEVKNYLQDSCLTKELEEQVEHLDDNLPSDVAIFYPLLFEDRIESLLVTKKYGVSQFTSEHSESLMATEENINSFRVDTSNILMESSYHAERIYKWFEKGFKQIKSLNIKNLVIVPQGKLYQLPFAAIQIPNYENNESRYLIQKHAINITPSVKLLANVENSHIPNDYMLLGGLSIIRHLS